MPELHRSSAMNWLDIPTTWMTTFWLWEPGAGSCGLADFSSKGSPSTKLAQMESSRFIGSSVSVWNDAKSICLCSNTTLLNSGICGARVEVSPGLRVQDHLRAQLGQQRPDLQKAEVKCTALRGETFGAQALACPDNIWVLPTRHPQNTWAAVQGKHGRHKILWTAIQLKRHCKETKRRVSCRMPKDETKWLTHINLQLGLGLWRDRGWSILGRRRMGWRWEVKYILSSFINIPDCQIIKVKIYLYHH